MNRPLKSLPVDQFKGHLFPWKKIEGNPLHLFHPFEGFFEGEIALLNRENGKIDKKS